MSKEEKLRRSIEKEKAEEKRIQEGHEKLKGFIGGFKINAPDTSDSVVNKSLEKADKWYENAFGNSKSIFNASNYNEVETPEERIVTVMEHPDGSVENVHVIPNVTRPWICEYYYTPAYKARLAIKIFVLLALTLLVMTSMTLGVTSSTIIALVLIFILMINTSFRYLGLAVYKWPMPKIPYFSDLRVSRQPIEEEEDEEEEYDTYEEKIESNSDRIPVVNPVNDYREGNPSPATLLTKWMNGVARMSEDDIIEQSGGVIDSFKMKLLLGDDKTAWMDYTMIDTLAKITGSQSHQWRDAFYSWDSSK